MVLLYITQSTVPGFFSSRPNWDPSRPLNHRRVCPPLLWFKGGGGHTLMRVRGSLYGVDVTA
jgi:hypothetical protein